MHIYTFALRWHKEAVPGVLKSTTTSKINVTLKGFRLSKKLQLTAALCNEI